MLTRFLKMANFIGPLIKMDHIYTNEKDFVKACVRVLNILLRGKNEKIPNWRSELWRAENYLRCQRKTIS